MPTYTVYFRATASATVEIVMPEGTPTEEIEDAAWQKLHTGLCHHCARKVDLGDFEPISVG